MVIVLGGGVSGLTASYFLLKNYGIPTAIFEATNRIGGWIRTENHPDKGFHFEYGPRTIRPRNEAGAQTLSLIEELGLDVEPIKSTHVAAKNRMIYAKGQLCPLPNDFSGIFTKRQPFTKPLYTALWKDLITNSHLAKFGDESIYDFVKRRFGTEIAEYAISPLICGICAGDAKEISVRFLMEELFEHEQRFGSVLKGMFMTRFFNRKKEKNLKNNPGILSENIPELYKRSQEEKWSMYNIKDGTESLTKTLGNYLTLNQVEINLCSQCDSILFADNRVRLKIHGNHYETDYVISAIPSYRLAMCLKDQHPGLAGQLVSIPYVDVAVVNFQFNVPTEDLIHNPAFGVLVPPIENRPVLGIIFDSCINEMESNTVITVMMGGKWFSQYFGDSPSQKDLRDIALQEVRTILGIQYEPKLSRVNILEKCIPQYNVGHKELISNINRYIERYKLPLSLCGAAYTGVGVNDAILSAKRCVDNLPKL